MSKIVRTVAKLIFVITIVFGIYVILNGHLTPGGGFQGGAIIATGFALLMIAFGHDFIRRRKTVFSLLESMGLLMFILLAFIGIKTIFFDNFLASPVAHGPNPGIIFSAGVIPLMNIAVGLEVLAALTMVLIFMSRVTEEDADDSIKRSGGKV